jgi:hypothetical protein
MDKKYFIEKAGTPSKLARLLGVTRQAVNNWQQIPKLRIFQLKVLRPEWFDVIN